VTTAAGVLDLATTYGQQPSAAVNGMNANNSIGSWASQITGICSTPQAGIRLVLQAITCNVGIILGTAITDVTGANAPVLATQGTVSAAGTYAGAAGTCWTILAGATVEFEAFAGQDVYLGFVGSTTGGLSIFQCSAPGA